MIFLIPSLIALKHGIGFAYWIENPMGKFGGLEISSIGQEACPSMQPGTKPGHERHPRTPSSIRENGGWHLVYISVNSYYKCFPINGGIVIIVTEDPKSRC